MISLKRTHICGALRPGFELRPPIGVNSIPCVRKPGHIGAHEDAWGKTWFSPAPSVVCCQCKRTTAAPVTIRSIETGSGPIVIIQACPGCAPRAQGAC
ncbi:hypothetical protein GCM10010357_28600 [Streptomyces luteireticuli]|uniref:Uncharacterized protein n=1 Tax=Streptomyces luteireticuli TaxID=173858 RepID=A0ABN0YQX2_9ACTN